MDKTTSNPSASEAITGTGPLRLAPRAWLATFCLVALCAWAIPRVWTQLEAFEPGPAYRIPYSLSGDHWQYERWAHAAQRHADALVCGDSVVWGEYVAPGQSLAGCVSRVTGKRLANAGVNGIHPLALDGLLADFTSFPRGTRILLHCNPLWMSSPRRDLSSADDPRFNHPDLVPQLVGSPPALQVGLSERIGNLLERKFGLFAWARHLQLTYYDGRDLYRWTVEHPWDNPLGPIDLRTPAPRDELRHPAISWTERRIVEQDLPWLEAASSLQWRAFRRTVDRLRTDGVSLFVLVGPFNEHLLTAASRERLHRLTTQILAELRDAGVSAWAPPSLPSELYADASHPLAAGYALLAEQLVGHSEFVQWLEH